MTYHHEPGHELESAANYALQAFLSFDLQQYISLTEEEQDLLASRLIRSFKELLPHRWQQLVDTCRERNEKIAQQSQKPFELPKQFKV